MTRSRLLVLLGGLSVSLAVAAVWLLQDNPTIDGTSRGDDYTCAAPYDTVFNGADNVPGGEPPPDSDAIAERCIDAGQERFAHSATAGGLALAVAGATAALGFARGRSHSTGPGESRSD